MWHSHLVPLMGSQDLSIPQTLYLNKISLFACNLIYTKPISLAMEIILIIRQIDLNFGTVLKFNSTIKYSTLSLQNNSNR